MGIAMKLRTKISLGIVALLSVLGLSIALLAKHAMSARLTAALHNDGLHQARGVAARSTDHVLARRMADLKTLLEDAKTVNHGVEYIYVSDSRGKLLAHTFAKGFPTDLEGINPVADGREHSLQHQDTDKGAILDVAVPLTNGQAGAVHVGISEEPVNKQIAEAALLITGIVAAVLAVGCAAAVALANIMVGPLIRLAAAARRIRGGDPKQKPSVETQDETGRFAMAFDETIEALNRTTASRDRLKAANQELMRAIERANQLAEAAEQAGDARSQFPADISDEIRTPMKAMIGTTESALETELAQEQR